MGAGSPKGGLLVGDGGPLPLFLNLGQSGTCPKKVLLWLKKYEFMMQTGI